MNEANPQIVTDDNNDDDTTNLSNDTRMNDFMKRTRKYGEAAALGADSLPKLAIDLTRMSKDGVIDLDANKKAIHDIYGVYWTGRTKKSVHDQGKEGRNAQVSKLKSFHTLGSLAWIDGEEVLNRAVTIYHDQLNNGTKLKSVYAAYVDVARMVNDRDETAGEPSDEELISAMLPKDKPEKTLADVVGHIKNQLADLVTDGRKDGISCQDVELTDAVEKLQDWLAKLTLQTEMDALKAKLAAMGMNIYVEPASCGEVPAYSGPTLQLVAN